LIKTIKRQQQQNNIAIHVARNNEKYVNQYTMKRKNYVSFNVAISWVSVDRF